VHRRAHANFGLGIEKIFPSIFPQSLESALRLGSNLNTKHKVGTESNLHRHPFRISVPIPLAPQRLPDLLHTPPRPPPRNVHPGAGFAIKTSISAAMSRQNASSGRSFTSSPNGFSISRPMAARPRMMYAAAIVPGMVIQPRGGYSWKGSART
jgi:hypothetical protein